MGPHGTPEERSAAEVFFALFRAKGYGVTNARGETATELYEKGYSSTTRDDKTIKLHIETAQEWRELTAKRLGVRIELVAQRFERETFLKFPGETVTKVAVLAGPISAHVAAAGLGIHIVPKGNDGGVGILEYVVIPGTPFVPPPPPPQPRIHFTRRNVLEKLRAARVLFDDGASRATVQ